MADRRCGNKKGVGEIGGKWWKDKDEVLVSDVDIDDRNLCKYENNSGT